MIWTILTELLAPIWPYIAGAGVVVAGWFAARRSGAKAQKAKQDAAQAKATIQVHEVRNEVEDRVARGGNARDRLRADWRE